MQKNILGTYKATITVEKTIEWPVVWAAATLMWLYCNDNAAKRDFESQTAYSQFGNDIKIGNNLSKITKSQTWEFGCFHIILNKQSRDQWLGRNDAHVRHGNANATKRDFSNGRINPWYE